jgi:hypothetical protein
VRRHWLARGLVAALHLALLAALWLYKPAGLREPSEKRLTTVRLILPKPSRPTPPPPSPPPAPAPRATTLPAEPRLVAPLPIPTETAPETAEAHSPVAAPPTEPARSTLRLTLPPGYAASSAAARNPALSDPRSNTPRPTLEDRIADAAGATGDWVAERTSDHRTLLRRGDTCVEALRSRIGDMDRFNENVAPRAVSMLGKPYKCK